MSEPAVAQGVAPGETVLACRGLDAGAGADRCCAQLQRRYDVLRGRQVQPAGVPCGRS